MDAVVREQITNTELATPYDWCIAGGFAACPDKASDCDVWVLKGTDGSLTEARDSIIQTLIAFDVSFVEEATNWDEVQESYTTGINLGSMKVARLADGRHIVVTNAESAAEILDHFDVSTHQVALTSDGELVRGSGFTPIDQPPVALLHNEKTDGRMEKVSRRYMRVQVTR